MKKFITSLLFLISFINLSYSQCSSIVYYDNMESFTWVGDWLNYNYSNFYTNTSVSPTASALHYGFGNGSSGVEDDWYVLPNISGLNPLNTYKVKFRVASLTYSSSASTKGVDAKDYIMVQLSTNGGVTYSDEIQIKGFDNATWEYSATGVASKTADGSLSVFQPSGGGLRTTDGYSTIELTLPSGSTQCAVDIYTRVNSAGEEWWIDNIELIEIIPQPILSINGNSPVCQGQSITLTASGAQSISWSNGVTNGNSFTPTSSSSYTVTGTNFGMVNGVGTQNTCVSNSVVPVTVSNVVTSTILSSGDMVWKGSSTSNYTSVANWLTYNGTQLVSSTSLPSSTTNVIIPSSQTCVLNQPNLGVNVGHSKNIIIEQGATINMGSGTLNVYGDFRNYGTFIQGTSTVNMVGSSNRDTIYGVGSSHSFYNLTINKSGGIEAVLGSHIDVTNELRVISKNLRLNSLNIDLGSTGVVMDEGPGHRIYCDCPVGFIQSTIDIPANTTVNPGNLGLTITTHNNEMGTTIIKRRHMRAGSSGSSELVSGTPGVYRIFDVTPEFNGGSTYPLSSGGLNVDLEFQYYIDEVGSEIINQESNFGLWRSENTGSSWEPHYGSVDINTKVISLQGWKEFSWVTGGPIESAEALPIELISFQVNCDDERKLITWSTASEHNSSHFIVEKSLDGNNWFVISEMDAAGNSNQTLNYNMVDYEKNNGTVYYRLIQYDNDGKYEIFNTVSVNCDDDLERNEITTYPNPSNENFYINFFNHTFNELAQINIMDGSGRIIYSKDAMLVENNNTFNIDATGFNSGIYYIQITDGYNKSEILKQYLN
jgi:hypothetical protein